MGVMVSKMRSSTSAKWRRWHYAILNSQWPLYRSNIVARYVEKCVQILFYGAVNILSSLLMLHHEQSQQQMVHIKIELRQWCLWLCVGVCVLETQIREHSQVLFPVPAK